MNKERIKENIVKIPCLIAHHAFLACLVLFLIAFALGVFLFYRYNILAKTSEFEDVPDKYLKEEVYNEVLSQWQKDEEKFYQADSKEYPDPFQRGLTD